DRQHEVVRGDVAVDDPLPVEIAEGHERLVGDLERQGEVEDPLRLEKIREGHPVDELHDQRGGAVGVEREVVDRADVGVLQARRRLRLVDEPALEFLVGGHVGLHHLDDADLVEEAVADLVDCPHPAFTNLGKYLVLSFDEREWLCQGISLAPYCKVARNAMSSAVPLETYDVVVIGSGPGGEKGAAQAAYFGKRVALVERAPEVGGAS